MDIFIQGLKFTQKGIAYMGGEGSGHHGHAGRPGSVGGSISKGLSMLMSNEDWKSLPEYRREQLTNDILNILHVFSCR